ncbi:MAG TPA: hypothetical protein PKE69_23420, partial [Pyrinomonadaceae bacterium]|nr:hypothetical protein [Pyrinomonadaceae bacterium]
TEKSLRKIDVLNDAFETYDRLSTEVVGQIPVMQRLQAKLILKGLLLLSLDGNGTTASEISAAMLIYDENAPERAAKNVEELLETFVGAFPDGIVRTAEAGREVRYSLKAENKENLNNALSEAAKKIPQQIIPKILRRFARERFSDWTISEDVNQNADWMDSQSVWRGGLRRGRIHWDFEGKNQQQLNSAGTSEYLDWEVFIQTPGAETKPGTENNNIPKVFWRP